VGLTDAAESRKLKSQYYIQGYDDYWYGKSLTQNPYLSNSVQYQQWSDGWNDASESDFEYEDIL
jgi:ribosome modulation factor